MTKHIFISYSKKKKEFSVTALASFRRAVVCWRKNLQGSGACVGVLALATLVALMVSSQAIRHVGARQVAADISQQTTAALLSVPSHRIAWLDSMVNDTAVRTSSDAGASIIGNARGDRLESMFQDCGDAPPSRLAVGGQGWVSFFDGEPLSVREAPGLNTSRLAALREGTRFDILEGPICANGFQWWRIQTAAVSGWIAEGQADVYFVAPQWVPTALAWDGTSLWVASWGLELLLRVDGESGAVVDELPLRDVPAALAWDGSTLWVTQFSRVLQVDVSSGEVVAEFRVGGVPSALVWDGSSLWVADSGNDTLMQVDVESATVVSTVAVGHKPVALAWDGTSLWVANQEPGSPEGTVMQVDVGSRKVVIEVPVGYMPGALAWDGASLWVANVTELMQVDVGSGSVVAHMHQV